MERSIGLWGLIVAVIFVLMIPQNAAQSDGNLYTCWGGCYNQCFILEQNPVNRYPCYFRCLPGCLAPSSGSTQYYCQVGCSAQLCLPLGSDAARLENCLGNCSNACGDN